VGFEAGCMTRLTAILRRMAFIFVGYMIACMCGSAIVAAGTLGSPLVLWFVLPFVAYFALLPSLVAIMISEFFAIRSWVFYAIAGGLVGAVVFAWLFGSGSPFHSGASMLGIALTMTSAGTAGGLAYWAVAGRNTGALRDAWAARRQAA